MLFDSHAHINNDTYTREDREALIRDIEASDLSYVMDIGFDLKSSRLAGRFSSISAGIMVGSRPWALIISIRLGDEEAKT